MKKKTVNFTLGIAVASLVMTGTSASAFGTAPSMQEMQNEMMNNTMNQVMNRNMGQMAPGSSMGQMGPTTDMITQMAQAGMTNQMGSQPTSGMMKPMTGQNQMSQPNQE